MGPIDYTSAFARVPSPAQAFTESFQGFAGVREAGLKMDAQEAALQQAQTLRADLAELSKNPTPQSIAAMSVKYPQLSEQFKRSYDMLQPEQQQGRLQAAIPVYAAIQNGRHDVAAQLLRDRAQAQQNSGQDQEAKQTLAMADMIEQHPETAAMTTGMLMASVMGPEKFADTFGKLGAERRADQLQPSEARKAVAGADKAESEAKTAAVTAQYAGQNALLDLEKKGWDIKKIKADIDIARESNRIAAMNAATAREGNSLKREDLKLKIEEARGKLDEKIRERVAEAESGRATTDNFLNTADRLLGLAVDKQGKPTSTLRAAAGPLDSRLPTMQTDVADLEALAETLGSQAFLSQIPTMKGTGNLSEKEGDKLQAALTNLSLRQSPEQFITNVKEAQRLILKARKNISTKYGIPDTVPDTPAAAPAPGEVDALVRKYLGQR